jgi:hypothetical protein
MLHTILDLATLKALYADGKPTPRDVMQAIIEGRARNHAAFWDGQVLTLTRAYDRDLLWRRQFLNPFAFNNAPSELRALVLDS